MVNTDKSNYEKMMSNYPILFCQRNKPMTETCMCWGIEVGNGWYKHLNEMCSYLEQLNKTYYSKYNVRIQADQVKEKYGEMRFYYSVVIDPDCIFRVLASPFMFISDVIKKHVNFKYETIVDSPAHTEERWNEISKEDFDNKKIPNQSNEYGWKFEQRGEKYFRNCSVMCMKRTHTELKNHFVLNWIRAKSYYFATKIRYCTKPNKKQSEIVDMLNHITSQLVKQCEYKCWNTCEWCGEENNSTETNIITTSGWISRICKKCSQNKIDENTKIYDENHPDNSYCGVPRITLFKEGYNFLNMYERSYFSYNGVWYSSIIHALFVVKDPTHRDVYDAIMFKCSGDAGSYIVEEVAKGFGVMCTDQDYDLIEKITTAKFTYKYDDTHKSDLINTRGKMLINMNKRCDNLWGICVCDKCITNQTGKNLYGQILTNLRKKLIEEMENGDNE